MYGKLLEKIQTKQFCIGILGQGYVGLPLAVIFAKNGVETIGIDISEEKIQKINRAENYIGDVEDNELRAVVHKGKLRATTDFSQIALCDALIICVPTPLDCFHRPDMSYIQKACEQIGKYMKSGVFISMESTTYPTTTENFILPLVEKVSQKKHGIDFWLGYSPERVDPGNKQFNTENTVKVLGALNKEGEEISVALYSHAIKEIHPVSSPRTAEMVKILENTYRLVNIALINELAYLSGKMGINIWEVIEAAKTKPFGFQAFYPGPGIGGHCIPLDPFYLEYIAKQFDFDLTMVNTAGHIHTLMTHRMVIKITSALNRQKKSVNGSKILIVGVSYKADINDVRESPALEIINKLKRKKGQVFYHDPYVPTIQIADTDHMESTPLSEELIQQMDCIVFTTNHSNVDYKLLVHYAQLIVDLKNVCPQETEKIVKL